MRSDCEAIPSPFTKAQADKAETMEAALADRQAQSRSGMGVLVTPGCQVYWPAPYEVCGLIKDKYNQTGGPNGFLLYPKTNELTNPGNTGKRSEFMGGNIYWSAPTGAHPVAHDFLTKWGEKGYEGGFLKYPTTDEIVLDDGANRRQEYQGGSIYFAFGIGAHSINGLIRDKWIAINSYKGYVGFPTSDELTTPSGVGRYNTFQYGSVYWSPTSGAHPVTQAIMERWSQDGYEQGIWGYPIADQTVDKVNRRVSQTFQGGTITAPVDMFTVPAAAGTYECSFYQKTDYVHISKSVPEKTANAHGWWENIDCPAHYTATVTVGLQVAVIPPSVTDPLDWHDTGNPGVEHGTHPGGGSGGNRASANKLCSTVPGAPDMDWRAWVDVDIEGVGDTPGKAYGVPMQVECAVDELLP